MPRRLAHPPPPAHPSQHTHPTATAADSNGNLWLFIGTEGVFEAGTIMRYVRISVTLTPVDISATASSN